MERTSCPAALFLNERSCQSATEEGGRGMRAYEVNTNWACLQTIERVHHGSYSASNIWIHHNQGVKTSKLCFDLFSQCTAGNRRTIFCTCIVWGTLFTYSKTCHLCVWKRYLWNICSIFRSKQCALFHIHTAVGNFRFCFIALLNSFKDTPSKSWIALALGAAFFA